MPKTSTTPDTSLPLQDDDDRERELGRLYREPAVRYGTPVVMCLIHLEAWFLSNEMINDQNIAEITQHFGRERDPQRDQTCEGTVVVVWSHSPDKDHMWETRDGGAEKGGASNG